jgi:RIO-like serine/threonine protein kinase
MVRLDRGELLSSGYQGSVYKVPVGDEFPDADYLIVKEAMGSPLVLWFRRWMIRREYKVYQRLDGVAGVPRCFGLDDDRLLLEFIDGDPLRLSAGELENRDRFFAALLEILGSIHRTGVAHADMKRKDNIIVTPQGLPCLIDFGSAVLRPSREDSWKNRLFRQACQIDLNAWVKHKYLGQYAEVTPEDAHFYAPTVIERFVRPIRQTWRKLTARKLRKAWRASKRR